MEYPMEEHIRKIRHKKKFFLKSFIISVIVLVIAYILAMLMYDTSLNLVERMYGLASEDYARIFVLLFGLWKILILQFTLVPWIVLGMVEGHIRKYHLENK